MSDFNVSVPPMSSIRHYSNDEIKEAIQNHPSFWKAQRGVPTLWNKQWIFVSWHKDSLFVISLIQMDPGDVVCHGCQFAIVWCVDDKPHVDFIPSPLPLIAPDCPVCGGRMATITRIDRTRVPLSFYMKIYTDRGITEFGKRPVGVDFDGPGTL